MLKSGINSLAYISHFPLSGSKTTLQAHVLVHIFLSVHWNQKFVLLEQELGKSGSYHEISLLWNEPLPNVTSYSLVKKLPPHSTVCVNTSTHILMCTCNYIPYIHILCIYTHITYTEVLDSLSFYKTPSSVKLTWQELC